MGRCQASIISSGRRCKNHQLVGYQFCSSHQNAMKRKYYLSQDPQLKTFIQKLWKKEGE